MSLDFDPSTYNVCHKGDCISLLAKEFALLQFLYTYRNQSFHREQLLDQVWKMEYPTDRTVDDHIYRLRKKLKVWQDVQIHTIHGYGYSLTIQEQRLLPNFPLADQEIQEHMTSLLKRYHLLGKGKSLMTLAAQQQVLGFEIEPFYHMYLKFILYDLDWFIEDQSFSINDKVYWLLLLHSTLQQDITPTLELWEKVLDAHILSADQQLEMKILNIVDLYIETEQWERAWKQLEETYCIVKDQKMESFELAVQLVKVLLSIVDVNTSDLYIETEMNLLNHMLNHKPYLREVGRYECIKGIWMLLRQSDQFYEGTIAIDQGLEILYVSNHLELYIGSLRQISHLLSKHLPEHSVTQKYNRAYEQACIRYSHSSHAYKIKQMIFQALGAV
ncbi:winged helix-turn-helix domain-containing protein [Paenibacillus sp. KACC 21273]|uniref:winged helix-turn-helix domain-containing protein n=1 Tax=Paenibacillus sp. KACC 21273 TaxID=3025665 RepID=UPI002366D6DE|nr:winged helix-turn-helix domain-containing protein [Paenibacillus sp. KACC 21273]WDF51839.1 winged helix-turn-helix domain-containing protein [Paenibacillus sp. KACC 21273]